MDMTLKNEMMKPATLIITILILTTGLNAFCGKEKSARNRKSKYPCAWKIGVHADGRADEWPSGDMYYDTKAKTFYAVSNDSAYLYCCIQITERSMQPGVLHDGIELWFDARGRKKKSCAVRITADMPKVQRPELPPTTPKKMIPKQAEVKFPATVVTRGFREGYNHNTTAGLNDRGFTAGFGTDSAGTLVLEVRVPLAALLAGPEHPEVLSMGFAITQEIQGHSGGQPPEGGGPQEDHGGMQGRGGSPGGGSMGEGGPGLGGPGRNGPGKGGPGEPPPGSVSQSQPGSFTIWHKFSLAPAP
jgi:hypothetical protein